MQEQLRKEVRLAKALNDDIYYKDFAEFLDITEHAFYNWLSGYYSLNRSNSNKLHELVIDMIDDY